MSDLAREPYHGVRQIVRFNWPCYAAAAALVLPAPFVIRQLPVGGGTQAALALAASLPVFWMAASLAVSWLVYDRSPLMSGGWIPATLGQRPRTWINIHAGLDELTPALRRVFGGSNGRAFDIFDAGEMTEPSIARARRRGARDDTEPVDYRRLPAPTAAADAVFLLLSAHELRTHHARCALLHEVRRVSGAGGRIVVAEHLRDLANMLAFGPGALHFHSRRTWTRAFEQAGLVVRDEFSITPFVRVFVLEARS